MVLFIIFVCMYVCMYYLFIFVCMYYVCIYAGTVCTYCMYYLSVPIVIFLRSLLSVDSFVLSIYCIHF